MNIREEIEQGQSKSLTLRITKYIGEDKARFKELVDIFLTSEYRVTQCAAWPLGDHSVEYPALVKPYLGKLIKKLTEPGQHPAIPRNILRIFQFIEIPEKYHGTLVDLCFKFIMDVSQPIAVRAFAITVAARICAVYSELGRELEIILEELKKYPQSPALTVRIREAHKILKAGSGAKN